MKKIKLMSIIILTLLSFSLLGCSTNNIDNVSKESKEINLEYVGIFYAQDSVRKNQADNSYYTNSRYSDFSLGSYSDSNKILCSSLVLNIEKQELKYKPATYNTKYGSVYYTVYLGNAISYTYITAYN